MNYFVLVLLSGVLVGLSALCSGLNVALLSLDLRDVKRKAKLGNTHAVRTLVIRGKVHFYLAGILLANVTFASATAVVLTDSLNGVAAVLISTLLLVVFAEITPQAIAVKYAMPAISSFSPAIKFVSYAAYPITKPLELLLNKLVGSSAGALHSRRELHLLMSEHFGIGSELDDDEIEIVQNALLLSEKRVREIMTPVEHVYNLFDDSVIDARKIDELKEENWSRIPIFNRKKTLCNSFLMLKDLVDIDFDERSWPVAELSTHRAVTVGSMMALDTLFRKFILTKRHMLIVERDDKICGIVTIEDLLEEIIGHEIEDEGDE